MNEKETIIIDPVTQTIQQRLGTLRGINNKNVKKK